MSYNINTVPFFTIKEKSSGPIDIIDHGTHFALYNNGDVWMSYIKGGDTEIRQMYSSYDLAYGDVLISGLGFGILALWLCNKPEVKSVTVVEISEDVIKLFKESNECPKKLNIINDSMITYNTDKQYDVLLLDHYERQSFAWRIKDINRICNRINHKDFWAWSLEKIYLFIMYQEFQMGRGIDFHKLLSSHNNDWSSNWCTFIDKHFPERTNLKNIPNDKINEYMYNFFNKETTF
jgi:hypothetical protein